MKKSILNLEEYGVTELSYLECQSIDGGAMYRLGQLVGHIANAWDAVVDAVNSFAETTPGQVLTHANRHW